MIDRTAFERMRRIVPTYLAARREVDGLSLTRALPEEVAFKLTNQCNLRCAHCYQWNEQGHHHSLDRDAQCQHLPFEMIAEVFNATAELQSNVYLWGGEPLLYQHWDELVGLLEADPRWTSICTNGILIEKRLESLLRISPRLELDIAVDGLEEEHDRLRGRGAFARTLRGVELLLQHRRRGDYEGEITVNCVITDQLVPRIEQVVNFWQETGIDTVYLGLLWHISEEASSAMDDFVAQYQPWTQVTANPGRPSWHAYKYRMNPSLVTPLLDQLDRIDAKSWRIKVRYNPALRRNDFANFISGCVHPVDGRKRCLAIHSRMDVLANGDVVSCKFFPESRIGNLAEQTTATAWQSEAFQRLRRTVDRCGLMPVCSKCSLLYARGA